jgi:hypothetical protein
MGRAGRRVGPRKDPPRQWQPRRAAYDLKADDEDQKKAGHAQRDHRDGPAEQADVEERAPKRRIQSGDPFAVIMRCRREWDR